MNLAIRFVAAGAFLLLASLTHAASQVPPEPAPGDRGVLLTVIQGEQIQEIPLTYLGVQRDLVGPGHDVHLVQLEGPIADRVGVAAGMSGSPVYFDGRLLGALAYRFGALPSEPVAGVTPIQDILHADREQAAAAGTSSALVAPIGTPIHMSGLQGTVREWAAPQFEDSGFVLVAGGASGDGSPFLAGELRPGSPVGVELIRGDMSVAATGTVTFVDGETVFAFGHPFLGSGRVEMPMVTAEVVHTLADLAGSVKLARVGEEVGAIFEDRLTAIVGTTARRASMIPVDLTVTGASYGEQAFRFEVARSRALSPLLASLAVANALSANLGHGRESTMLSTGTIQVKGQPELPVEIAAASGAGVDPAIGVAVRLQQTLGSLWTNPFAEVELQRVSLQVTVLPEVRRYRLEELNYDRGALSPGQTLQVTCVLRAYRGERITKELELVVPEGLTGDKRLALAVGPPGHVDRALGGILFRRYKSAGDLSGVIQVLSDLRADNRLTAVLYQQTAGVVSGGVAYADLPPSAQRLLSARVGSGEVSRTRVADLARTEAELDGPVEGGIVVRLQVESGGKPDSDH